MPELPEVETIRRTLTGHLIGQIIRKINIYWASAVIGYQDESFLELIHNRRIIELDRRGKYLLIHLDQDWTLIAHMRMTGRLNYFPSPNEPAKHTHVVFCLDQGELHFQDTRKFGRIQAVPTKLLFETKALARLGPEPLTKDFVLDHFATALQRKKVKIKAALLDQSLLAGIGNIYADEALFMAGIHPNRIASSLNTFEIQKLYQSIQTILQAAIDARGTSFRDYRDGNGDKGKFLELVQVYGRAGEKCKFCSSRLEKIRISGRTSVFCPVCQR